MARTDGTDERARPVPPVSLVHMVPQEQPVPPGRTVPPVRQEWTVQPVPLGLSGRQARRVPLVRRGSGATRGILESQGPT